MFALDGFRWDYSQRGFSPQIEALGRDGVRATSKKLQNTHTHMHTHSYACTHTLTHVHIKRKRDSQRELSPHIEALGRDGVLQVRNTNIRFIHRAHSHMHTPTSHAHTAVHTHSCTYTASTILLVIVAYPP